jgi:iron complex outermembrane receptor protein
MFYAGYSSGFKSGGFNRQSGNPTPFDPETVDTYSLGMKSTWLDGGLRLNGEIFYNDYQDKQLATIGLVGGDLAQVTDNVGELETSGAEVELTWLPAVDGLLVGLNVGYLDSDVKEFLVATEGGTVDISDDVAMGFAPEWTVQARVNYDFDIGSAGSLMFGTDVSYRTESYTALTVNTSSPAADAQVQDEHAIWNAIAAWRSPNQNWRVAVEGKNLTDERVQVNTFDLDVFITTGWNLPRTWAVTVGYEF